MIWLLLALCVSLLPRDSFAQIPGAIPVSSSAGVITEAAEYVGRVDGQQIVDGVFSLQIVNRAEGPSWIDWTSIQVAMSGLAWEKQPLIAGMNPARRMMILTQRDSDLLNGHWSLRGQEIGGVTIFDLRLPPALNTRLLLDLPRDLELDCRPGLVHSGEEDPQSGLKKWTIELGSVSTATATVRPAGRKGQSAQYRYEIDTEYRVRRDGVFIRSDLTIEGQLPTAAALKLRLPANVEIQSVAAILAGTPGGANLPFQRRTDLPQEVLVPLDSLNSEPNVLIRIRAFEPVNWKGIRHLPRLRLADALETRRTLTLRIEPPLQLQEVDAGDLLQTALMSSEATGEIWRFEGRSPDTELSVRVGLPDAPLTGQMFCLSDARPDAGWSVAMLTLQVENGARFETTIQLPDDWRLISVSGPDAESRIASWEVVNQVLSISWQNPLTRNSPRQLRLLSRNPSRKPRTPFRLSLPQVRGAHDFDVQYQLMLPMETEFQILEGDGWRVQEGGEVLPVFLPMRDVAERLPPVGQRNLVTLRTELENQPARILATILPRTFAPPTGSSPNPHSGTSSTGTAVTDSESVAVPDASNVAAGLELLTIGGQTNQLECVHHASITFDRPVHPGTLQLELPEECRLSVLKLDDQPMTVFRNGSMISIPADFGHVSRVHLTYVTACEERWLSQYFSVPLPAIALPIQTFQWTLDLPGMQQLSQVKLPAETLRVDLRQRSDFRLFGPIARPSGQGVFNPFSLKDWSEIAGRADEAHPSEERRRTWHFVAPESAPAVQFVTWNGPVARRYAWVALLGCMLTGLLVRLLQRSWLQKISVLWILLLVVLIGQANSAAALILGGALSGSLLSQVFPRRWILERVRFSESSPKSQGSGLVTASLILLAVVAGSGWVLLNSRQVSAAEVIANPEPESLIRSARYRLIKAEPVTQIAATFEVLMRRAAGSVFLKIPLQDVVFHSAPVCQVNGVERQLIPSLAGDAMLVNFTEADELAATAITGTDWLRHEVQLVFSLRGDSSLPEAERLNPHAIVPRVLDSTLKIAPEQPVQSWERFGELLTSPEGETEIQLGPIGRLAVDALKSPDQATGPPAASIQTLAEVTPQRIRCQSRLQPPAGGWPALLPLTFPTGSRVNAISGANVVDWIESSDPAQPDRSTVRLQKNGIQPLLLQYEFPATSVSGTTMTLPAINLLNAANVPHYLGLVGPPLTTLEFANQTGTTPLTLEEWQALGEFGRSRPTLTMLLRSPISLTLDQLKMKSQRSSTVAEMLKVRRDVLEYGAIVTMTVTEAPTFRHQFELDPSVHLESVQVGLMGNDGAVRFTRRGNVVTLYVAGGQLGERVFHFKGRIPSAIDVWTSIPELKPIESLVTERQLTVLDETDWNVELEGDNGEPLTSTPQELTPGQKTRLIANYRQSIPLRRMRVTLPARAIQADFVTLIDTSPQKDWELVTTVHLTSADAPLKRIVLHVPSELTGIRVRPSLFQYSAQPASEGTLLTIRVPDRYSSAATLTVSSRLSSELMEQVHAAGQNPLSLILPQIRIQSATLVSNHLLLDFQSGFQPVGGVRVSPDSLPKWLPQEWLNEIEAEKLVGYHQNQQQVELSRARHADQIVLPTVQFEETLLWPESTELQKGISRWWLMPNGAREFTFTTGPGVTVDQIWSQSADDIRYEKNENEIKITCPSREGVIPVLIHWSSERVKGMHPLLQAPFVSNELRAVAVIRPRQWTFHPGNAAELSRDAFWLERWSALNDCWNFKLPIQQNSPALWNSIEVCRQQLQNVPERGTLSAKQLAQWESLSQRWHEVLDQPLAAGEQEGLAPSASDALFRDALTRLPATFAVDWIRPHSANWTGFVTVRHSSIHWVRLILSIVLLITAAQFLWRNSDQFSALWEFGSAHPWGGLLILGVLWWLFLSPSLFGLGLTLVSAVMVIRDLMAVKTSVDPGEEVTQLVR